MANRVVLGPLPGGGTGLRVSRPGANVLDNGLPPNQVAFDSRWLDSSRIFMRGSVSVPNSGSSDTVNFGTTFSAPPPVILMFRIRGNGRWVSGDNAVSPIVDIPTFDPSNAEISAALSAATDDYLYEIFTNRIVVYRRGGADGYDHFSYIVLRR